MNIKTLVPNINSVQVNPATQSVSGKVKAENSSPDRDADGKRHDGGAKEGHKEHLNEEEMEIALENLRSLEGVKNNHLDVSLVTQNSKRFVLVKDLEGKVIRRIPESELWPMIVDKDKKTGSLLNKAG